MNLTQFLQQINPERLAELLWLGAIYVDEVRAETLTQTLPLGAKLRVHFQPRRFYNGALSSRVVDTQPDYVLVDKPGGLPTHALVDNCQENLITLLQQELQQKLFITHRLDVATSGIVILARNQKAQARINEEIKNHSIKRFYEAWVKNPVLPDHYVHYMEPSPKAPKKVSLQARPGWLRCELRVLSCNFEKLLAVDDCFRLEIELLTGRSQQIRAQLAELGSPIVGDESYGATNSWMDPLTRSPAIGLRAFKIEGLGF